jgi:hypothetical protein
MPRTSIESQQLDFTAILQKELLEVRKISKEHQRKVEHAIKSRSAKTSFRQVATEKK